MSSQKKQYLKLLKEAISEFSKIPLTEQEDERDSLEGLDFIAGPMVKDIRKPEKELKGDKVYDTTMPAPKSIDELLERYYNKPEKGFLTLEQAERESDDEAEDWAADEPDVSLADLTSMAAGDADEEGSEGDDLPDVDPVDEEPAGMASEPPDERVAEGFERKILKHLLAEMGEDVEEEEEEKEEEKEEEDEEATEEPKEEKGSGDEDEDVLHEQPWEHMFKREEIEEAYRIFREQVEDELRKEEDAEEVSEEEPTEEDNDEEDIIEECSIREEDEEVKEEDDESAEEEADELSDEEDLEGEEEEDHLDTTPEAKKEEDLDMLHEEDEEEAEDEEEEPEDEEDESEDEEEEEPEEEEEDLEDEEGGEEDVEDNEEKEVLSELMKIKSKKVIV
jgi:hypothetical protein